MYNSEKSTLYQGFYKKNLFNLPGQVHSIVHSIYKPSYFRIEVAIEIRTC